MTTSKNEKLHDLLCDFDTAMLVTRTADSQLRSRPMVLADVDDDGTLWFLSQLQSGKIADIDFDDHVNVAMQSKFKFVSISGKAATVQDRKKIDELWNETWKTWFPGGKNDPSLALMRVSGETGEYWDNSGSSGIKYLIKAGQAYLSGTRPDVANDPQIHGKVAL